jgi:hypothetical protein
MPRAASHSTSLRRLAPKRSGSNETLWRSFCGKPSLDVTTSDLDANFSFRSTAEKMAGTTRLELATSAVTGQRSNRLNYVPAVVAPTGGRSRI